MPNLKHEAKTAFIWDFVGKLAMQGSGFIVTIFLARLLQPSDFGLIAMIMVIIGIAGVFTDIGLGGALVQRRRLLPIHYSSVFYFNLFVAMVLTLITFFSASWIGEFYSNPAIVPIARTVSILFIIRGLSSVQNTKLEKELNFPLITKMSFISSLMSGAIGIGFAFSGAGVWSLVAQSLSQGIIYNLLLWNSAQWHPTMQFSSKALFQLWGFGFRMFLSGLLDVIFTRIHIIYIGKFFSPAILGFYQQANNLNSLVVKYTSDSLMSVLFPVLSKIQNDLPRFQQVVTKTLGILSFVVFLLLGGLYVTSHELIVMLFGAKWEPSVHYFKILALSGFDIPISALLVNILRSRGKSKEFLKLEIYKKLFVTINFFILYFYGIDAFLYAFIVTATISVVLNAFFAMKEIKLPFTQLTNPIMVQGVIAIISSVIALNILSSFNGPLFLLFLVHGFLFTSFYLLFSFSFNTEGYKNISAQLKPYLEKIITSKGEF